MFGRRRREKDGQAAATKGPVCPSPRLTSDEEAGLADTIRSSSVGCRPLSSSSSGGGSAAAASSKEKEPLWTRSDVWREISPLNEELDALRTRLKDEALALREASTEEESCAAATINLRRELLQARSERRQEEAGVSGAPVPQFGHGEDQARLLREALEEADFQKRFSVAARREAADAARMARSSKAFANEEVQATRQAREVASSEARALSRTRTEGRASQEALQRSLALHRQASSEIVLQKQQSAHCESRAVQTQGPLLGLGGGGDRGGGGGAAPPPREAWDASPSELLQALAARTAGFASQESRANCAERGLETLRAELVASSKSHLAAEFACQSLAKRASLAERNCEATNKEMTCEARCVTTLCTELAIARKRAEAAKMRLGYVTSSEGALASEIEEAGASVSRARNEMEEEAQQSNALRTELEVSGARVDAAESEISQERREKAALELLLGSLTAELAATITVAATDAKAKAEESTSEDRMQELGNELSERLLAYESEERLASTKEASAEERAACEAKKTAEEARVLREVRSDASELSMTLGYQAKELLLMRARTRQLEAELAAASTAASTVTAGMAVDHPDHRNSRPRTPILSDRSSLFPSKDNHRPLGLQMHRVGSAPPAPNSPMRPGSGSSGNSRDLEAGEGRLRGFAQHSGFSPLLSRSSHVAPHAALPPLPPLQVGSRTPTPRQERDGPRPPPNYASMTPGSGSDLPAPSVLSGVQAYSRMRRSMSVKDVIDMRTPPPPCVADRLR